MDNLSNIDVPILDTKYLVNVFSTLIQSWIGNCVIPVKYNISIPYLKELELSKIGITIIRSKTGKIKSIVCNNTYKNLNEDQIMSILNSIR